MSGRSSPRRKRSTLLSSRTREKIRALLVARRNTVLHDAHPSEIVQASLKLSPVAANDEEDAAAIRPVGDAAAQTVDSAPGVGYSLWNSDFDIRRRPRHRDQRRDEKKQASSARETLGALGKS